MNRCNMNCTQQLSEINSFIVKFGKKTDRTARDYKEGTYRVLFCHNYKLSILIDTMQPLSV